MLIIIEIKVENTTIKTLFGIVGDISFDNANEIEKNKRPLTKTLRMYCF